MVDMKMMCLLVVAIAMVASNAHALPKTTDDLIEGIIENLQSEVHDLKQLQQKNEDDEKKEENGEKYENIFGDDVTVVKDAGDKAESIYEVNVKDKTQENFEAGNLKEAEEDDDLQGDVLVTPVQTAIEDYDAQVGNDATILPWRLWREQSDPAGTRIRVPYALTSAIRYDPAKMAAINTAIANYAAKTCIDFYEKSSSENVHHISIINGQGCYSYIGKVGITTCPNCQPVSIGNGCQYSGTVEHEFMHALGFYHEQSRPDRDDFVEIKWGNIIDGFDGNFKKESQLNSGGEPYDLDSVMHYGGTFFSKNGQPTIVYKGTNTGVVAKRDGFSPIDVAQINAVYKCEAPATTTTTTTTLAPTTTTTEEPAPTTTTTTLAPTTTTTEEPNPPTSPAPTEAPAPSPEPAECEALAEVGMCAIGWICNSCGIQCHNAEEEELKLDLKDIKKNQCKKWQAKGYCEKESKYHKFMLHKCHKTCFETKYAEVLHTGECIPESGIPDP